MRFCAYTTVIILKNKVFRVIIANRVSAANLTLILCVQDRNLRGKVNSPKFLTTTERQRNKEMLNMRDKCKLDNFSEKETASNCFVLDSTNLFSLVSKLYEI